MTAIATLPVLAQQGTHAARPAASAVGSGALYACTTHGLIYQMLAGSWGTWFTPGGFANPMTTAEDIIYGGASGAPTRKAKGSDGTFLGVAAGALLYQAVTDALLSTSDITTNNASTTKHGFAPKYPNDATKYLDGTGAYTVPAGGGGGALVLLEQHTGSGAGPLDFTTFISSTYDEYMFEIVDLLMTTDNSNLLMRFGTGGGPTYDTANHSTDGLVWRNGNSGTFGGTNLGGIELDDPGGAVDNSTADDAFNGQLRLFNPQGSHWKRVDGQTSYRNNFGPSRIGTMVRGAYESNTAVTAIRFLSDGASPNIASGTIRVYGIAKT
jgi:hypothetical protein